MTRPAWVSRRVIDAVHEMQLAEHGGGTGIRDEGLLISALARPENAFDYGETDLCMLAALYTFGIARNHPYVDGNKRTAFLAAYIFLALNELELVADEIEATTMMLRVAAGACDEQQFRDWLAENTVASAN